MKILFPLKAYTLILLITGLLFSVASYAQAMPVAQPISKQEINQFARAIATIQHFYITQTTDKKLFNDAIEGMLSSLDPHSSFLDSKELKALRESVSGKFVGIGIELTYEKKALKVISPLDGSPAAKAGIKANDLIIKINDTLVHNMTLNQAVNRIKGKKGTNVQLTIIRKDAKKPLQLTITRNVIKLVAVKSKLLQDHYGYIRITFFQGPVSKQLHAAINKLFKESHNQLAGVILDLRNNPGGLLDESAKVADTFLNAAKIKQYHDIIVYTKGRIPQSKITLKAHPEDRLHGLPMVTLINVGSASASEIVAGALQDYHRSIIMGTRSFGKGSVQTIIPISQNSAIKLTTALYYTPSGHVIQARGIVPDVSIPALTVDKKDLTHLINIDEADYDNHLLNKKDSKAYQAQNKKLKEEHTAELKMAKKDYQLYSAFMMLKGINALAPHAATHNFAQAD